jgi:hypothetical protein
MKNWIWIVIHAMVVLGILLLGFSPFFFVIAAGNIASANGCQLDEGSIHPCVVNGVDRGQELYTWGVMGWVGVVTLPLSILAAGAYLFIVVVVVIIRYTLRQRKKAKLAEGVVKSQD